MLFSSIYFLYYFLPAIFVVYFLAPTKYKNLVLLIFSLFFYSWGEPIYVILMIFSALFNYVMAIDISNEKNNKLRSKFTFVFTIFINLFILSFFKYYGFFMDSVNQLLGSNIKYTALALPIGISFYTFQALSYIVDVYRQKVKVQSKFLDFALYLALFPQLIAGPIVQYKDIETQLKSRVTTIHSFGQGAERFILGLGKKVLLANNFGAIFTYVISLPVDQQSTASLWIAALAYTLQIYFDFSGYSDMAIGLGKIFGFTFMENFNYPYISTSITEFWRRWHISLSSWFRDYLYIPLGGNRVKVKRHILNLLIVWALTGLWHGANYNFILWGVYYGLLLIGEKYLWGLWLEKQNTLVKRIYALSLVNLGWVLFSCNSFVEISERLKGMFFLGGIAAINMTTLYILRTSFIIIAIGIVCSTPQVIEQYRKLKIKKSNIALFLIFMILMLSTAYLIYSSYNPFLYFRF